MSMPLLLPQLMAHVSIPYLMAILRSIWYSLSNIYRVIQNKREKIEQDIGGALLNNLRWEPGVHEASLRKYGSKLVYHIIVYFLFTLVTVTCKYSTLTQLTYNFASCNSCSNWRPPTLMQPWHRRTWFCRTLIKYPWCVLNNGPQVPTSNCSVEHPIWPVQYLHALTEYPCIYIYIWKLSFFS